MRPIFYNVASRKNFWPIVRHRKYTRSVRDKESTNYFITNDHFLLFYFSLFYDHIPSRLHHHRYIFDWRTFYYYYIIRSYMRVKNVIHAYFFIGVKFYISSQRIPFFFPLILPPLFSIFISFIFFSDDDNKNNYSPYFNVDKRRAVHE